jgi:hypothetical protein
MRWPSLNGRDGFRFLLYTRAAIVLVVRVLVVELLDFLKETSVERERKNFFSKPDY